MIYFDSAFIGKCYLNEPNAPRVRQIARAVDRVYSCELARVEFMSLVRRQFRERAMTAGEVTATLREFGEDERAGVWEWLPINSALVEATRRTLERLPGDVVLRAGDALHLACARQHGFGEIYSNDRRMLAAAQWFGIEGVNPLA